MPEDRITSLSDNIREKWLEMEFNVEWHQDRLIYWKKAYNFSKFSHILLFTVSGVLYTIYENPYILFVLCFLYAIAFLITRTTKLFNPEKVIDKTKFLLDMYQWLTYKYEELYNKIKQNLEDVYYNKYIQEYNTIRSIEEKINIIHSGIGYPIDKKNEELQERIRKRHGLQ